MPTAISKLNKTELHRHLDCSMRFKTMLTIAQEAQMIFPATEKEQRDFFLVTSPMDNLGIALSKFQKAQKLLFSEQILEDLAFATIQEASLENTKLLELRYSPTFIQDGHSHLSWDQIHQAFLRGIEKAQKAYTIAVGLIVIIQRTLPREVAESLIDFVINHKNTVIGIDLADNEDGFQAKPFEKIFQKAKSAGLSITVHAGEIPTQQSILNIEDSIRFLGANRIGHGIQAIHSPSVLKLLRDENIPLEVCPTSNYLTQVVPKLTGHPLRSLFNEGILLTINTDDPGLFDYTLSDELKVVHDILGFSESELKLFQKIGFEKSFIDKNKKSQFNPFFEDL